MDIRPLQDVEVLAEGLEFPEGPVALADGSILVVEIFGGRVTRIGSDGTKDIVAEVGGGPNGAAIGPDGAVYVCNNGGLSRTSLGQSGIQRVDLDTGATTQLYTESDGKPLVSPNDLVFDETGNFWFSDFGGGTLHYAAADGSSIRTVVTRAAFPNGVGLSPDGTILYWAQTHTRQILRRRIVAPGELAPSAGLGIRPLVFGGDIDRFMLLAGMPGGAELDSLAVDSSGAVCVGTLVESGITEVPEAGGLDEAVRWTLPEALDDAAVTNIAFGGDDLTDAYLTCSLTGRLVRARWHRPGLPLAF